MRLSRILPRRMLGSAAFTAVGKRIFPRADVALQRVSRGHASLAGSVGMPLLMLETTGRRSGEPRVTPLIYVTQGTDFLVIGSNWGQRLQPAWALNLLAEPKAAVSVHGTRIPVTARRLQDAERTAAWALMLDIWPAYDEYARRVDATSGRDIMVFRLERDR
jgi:deazaflavin-dependent oxidoreductase (nitroreductase family)